jgi:hypothetical protein
MSINQPGSHLKHTERQQMNVLTFTAWAVYMTVTAVWLGDNGWTPIVGVPWIIIGFGYLFTMLKMDYERRR